jgi:hypothetical protein
LALLAPRPASAQPGVTYNFAQVSEGGGGADETREKKNEKKENLSFQHAAAFLFTILIAPGVCSTWSVYVLLL